MRKVKKQNKKTNLYFLHGLKVNFELVIRKQNFNHRVSNSK